jgi:PAS domain S-box-containing protein
LAGQEADGEQLLTSLFTSMHTGVYATDTEGRALLVNPSALRLLGREGEDLTGASMHGLVHYQSADGEPLSAAACPLLGVISTGTPARSDDDTFWRGDGTPLPVSWISAPVVEDGRVTGAVVVFSDATTRHVETERLLAEHQATLVEHRVAVAAHARLAHSADRLAMLDRVSEALSTLDRDKALRRLARLTVARVADWCVVDAVEGAVVRRVAVARHDPAARPETEIVRLMPPLRPGASGPLTRVLSTGIQQAHAWEAGRALDVGGPDDPLEIEQARLLDDVGCAHALVTPLSVRHQVLGAMTWVRTDPGLPFTEQDEVLAAEIGRRAGIALENARLYGQQREAAVALQRSLLTVLPEPDHLQIAARYLPASAGVEIGGDWYDAFLLADGATSIVIGDILGHDLAAAAHMGQVRNLLRGIASDRLCPPSDIVARLDQAIRSLDVGALATCLLARIEQPPEQRDAGLRTLRWTSAGHLPPALVSASGQVRLLDEPGDLMLGVDPGLPRSDHSATIRPDDTIWLYTDGLVERSDQSLDQGLARLRRTLGAVAHLPLEPACDLLLQRMLPDGHPDDVALLAVRAHPEDRPRPVGAGPAHA